MAGETIKMTVEIEGEPKPEVTWWVGENILKLCFNYKIAESSFPQPFAYC